MVSRYTLTGQAARISFSELCAAKNTRLPNEEDLATLKKYFRNAIDQIHLRPTHCRKTSIDLNARFCDAEKDSFFVAAYFNQSYYNWFWSSGWGFE